MPGVEKAYIVPGLPHLVFGNGAWSPLKAAFKKAGENARALKPDLYVIYSSQWISVLGHSFQADPNPKGVHVDENWYDLGDFHFSLKVDVGLAEKAAQNAQKKALATKLVNYQGFPIDTGTLVAMHYFNPDNSIPVMIVSSNIYASHEDSYQLGQACGEALAESGKRAVLIDCSGLSYRFITDDIRPEQDRIARPEDDEWNKRVLDLLGKGQTEELMRLAGEFAQKAAADAMFKGYFWLMGALNKPTVAASILAYGPVWGTGAAVVEFSLG